MPIWYGIANTQWYTIAYRYSWYTCTYSSTCSIPNACNGSIECASGHTGSRDRRSRTSASTYTCTYHGATAGSRCGTLSTREYQSVQGQLLLVRRFPSVFSGLCGGGPSARRWFACATPPCSQSRPTWEPVLRASRRPTPAAHRGPKCHHEVANME